jgi:hypothetical protein
MQRSAAARLNGSFVALLLGLRGAQGASAGNVTIQRWDPPGDRPSVCMGTPASTQSYVSNTCYERVYKPPPQPPTPPGVPPSPPSPMSSTWFQVQCTGMFTMDVVLDVFAEPECGGEFDRSIHDAGVCLRFYDDPNMQMMFSCEGEDDESWPIPGMSLVVVGVIAICLFGRCRAQRAAGGRRRRPTRSVSGESIYDPQQYNQGAGRPSQPRVVAPAAGGATLTAVAVPGAEGFGPLPPAAAAIVEAAGDRVLTMQQITQQVLRSAAIKPAEKRHFMMLLFRHYGFAGDDKPAARDPERGTVDSPVVVMARSVQSGMDSEEEDLGSGHERYSGGPMFGGSE